MKIAMTADELKTLTEDLVDEGINLGWLTNEYDDDAPDVFCIMERALAVLGIDIVEYEDEDENEDEEYDYDNDDEEEDDSDELPPDPFDVPVESLLVEIEGKKFLRKDDADIVLNYITTAIDIKCQDMTLAERHELVVGLWNQFGKDFNIAGVLMDV